MRKRIFCFFGRLQFLLSLLVVLSCSEKEVEPEKVLISSENILDRNASEFRTFLAIGGLQVDLDELKYDVDIYSITYKTSYFDDEITASAIVTLPQKAGGVGMIGFQHGTIAAHSQAPTTLPTSSTELVLYSALASPGFIAVVPDLIGFGASESIQHPYYIETLTASAVIDAMKAARNLADEKGVSFNGRLFLAGYSQGGYATMAAHKAIEQDGLSGFELVASFPSSGGYDIKAMQEYFFGLTTYDDPFYLAFVAQGYSSTYNWLQPLSDYFKEPYAGRIPSLVNGSKTASEINAQLTTNIVDLLTNEIRANIDTDPKYDHLVDAFIENSLTDWAPLKPMFMYHGDADVTVPYNNSVVTYNKLISNGASASIVTLTALPGADHGGGVFPYAERFIPKMLELR